MPDARLLLVEDDLDLGGVLQKYLELSGLATRHAATGGAGLEALAQARPDLCILDVALPDMDGFTLAERIRARAPGLPFLFLTARALKHDRLRGLGLGAEDYVTKPFEADELVLRIRNILRRPRNQPAPVLDAGRCLLDPEARVLRRGGEELSLSRKETDILRLLLDRRDRLVRRADILERLWGRSDYFLGRSLDVFITRLRKLLGADAGVALDTVRGEGYILRTGCLDVGAPSGPMPGR
jgi:DNA-binding response OmpR family regulator